MLLAAMTLTSRGQKTLVVDGGGYGLADTVLYYVPSQYSQDSLARPAVILLHGYGGSHRQWPGISPLQDLADDYGMVILCPDGFKDSWYIDSRQGNYATFFAADVMREISALPEVDSLQMFITGLSMGGHGALHLMIKCPGRFLAAGSMSGVLDLRQSSLAKTSLARLLGPQGAGNPNWAKFSAVDNVEAVANANTPLIISCGAQDYLIECNRTFARKCSALGINVVYTESPGRHERPYWRITLPEHLRFFRKYINKSINY